MPFQSTTMKLSKKALANSALQFVVINKSGLCPQSLDAAWSEDNFVPDSLTSSKTLIEIDMFEIAYLNIIFMKSVE